MRIQKVYKPTSTGVGIEYTTSKSDRAGMSTVATRAHLAASIDRVIQAGLLPFITSDSVHPLVQRCRHEWKQEGQLEQLHAIANTKQQDLKQAKLVERVRALEKRDARVTATCAKAQSDLADAVNKTRSLADATKAQSDTCRELAAAVKAQSNTHRKSVQEQSAKVSQIEAHCKHSMEAVQEQSAKVSQIEAHCKHSMESVQEQSAKVSHIEAQYKHSMESAQEQSAKVSHIEAQYKHSMESAQAHSAKISHIEEQCKHSMESHAKCFDTMVNVNDAVKEVSDSVHKRLDGALNDAAPPETPEMLCKQLNQLKFEGADAPARRKTTKALRDQLRSSPTAELVTQCKELLSQ
jgi:hypothetical protein